MDSYILAKTLHILSSTVLFGTGIGSAFYMLAAGRQEDPRVAHFIARHVVIADFAFIAPAVVLQPATGFYLVHAAQIPLASAWLVAGIALYLLAGACWVPAVMLQVRMRDLAGEAVARAMPLPDAYRRCFRAWIALGIPAFAALLAVFWLMVAQPASWGL